MATFRGLVQTLQIRDDGWVEVIIQAVHAGNATQAFFIKNLDGDITMAHKRLGQLSLLRDAITRILPVEIDYETDEAQGNLISEVMIHPRPSIAGRSFGSTIQGIVIGVSITELGPISGLYPYSDAPDLAGITLLKDDGTLVTLQLDLQREEALTMHAMLALLQAALANRRPVIVVTASAHSKTRDIGHHDLSSFNASTSNQTIFIESCEWVTVPEESLTYCYAFIERLGQRYESYDSTDATALSYTRVVYTTAPTQSPAGDISDNGLFQPVTQTAWIHDNSPLLCMLRKALKNSLQVQLGLVEDQIHEVVLISHLGSASRPIWICVNQSFVHEHDKIYCNNVPTIQSINNSAFNTTSLSLSWKGKGYFNEGIWRFQITTTGAYTLEIDHKLPCCAQSADDCCCEKSDSIHAANHIYLKGMHTVELTLYDQQMADPFTLLVYRIR